MSRVKLSILIPCHNAADTITSTLIRIIKSTNEREQIEIIVIENASTDNSLEVLENFLKNSENIIQLKVYQSAKGLGSALRTGVANSIGQNIAFVADDMPFGMQEIEYGLSRDLKNGEYTIFSKYKSWVGLKRNPIRSLSGLGFVFMRELMLKTRVLDSQGTFCANNVTIKSIFEMSSEREFLVSTEAILIARKLGFEIKEVPIKTLEPRIRPSTINLGDIKKMLISLYGLRKSQRNIVEI